MSKQYLVVQMGMLPTTAAMRKEKDWLADVSEFVADIERFGPFERGTAGRKAIMIYEETGANVEIRRPDSEQWLAKIRDGEFLIEQEHDEEGCSLPREDWFDFWDIEVPEREGPYVWKVE